MCKFYLAICKYIYALFLIAFFSTITFSDIIIKEAKTTAIYHLMCGCNNIIYFNRLDDNIPENSFMPKTSELAKVITQFTNSSGIGLVKGSEYCNRIETAEKRIGLLFRESGSAFLHIPQRVIDCFMKGRYTRLEGYYLGEAEKVISIWVSYKLYKGDPQLEKKVTLEVKKLMGLPHWNKFEYHIDLTAIDESVPVSDMIFFVQSPRIDGIIGHSPKFSSPVLIDELTMCTYRSLSIKMRQLVNGI